jgi:DNA-binding CsgD family transcriptional regulator
MTVLTERQSDVLVMAADGVSSKEIGAEIGIRAQAVDGHLKAVRRKLGASTQGQAIALAVDAGVLALPRVRSAAPVRLTRIQLEALDGSRKGFDTGEIGTWLGMSRNAVCCLLRRAYITLGARNRTHAIARCYQLGIFKGEGEGS